MDRCPLDRPRTWRLTTGAACDPAAVARRGYLADVSPFEEDGSPFEEDGTVRGGLTQAMIAREAMRRLGLPPEREILDQVDEAMEHLGDAATWPPDLLALVREAFGVHAAAVPPIARALLEGAELRLFERAAGALPAAVRLSLEGDSACSAAALASAQAFAQRVFDLAPIKRGLFSRALRECARLLAGHKQRHRLTPDARCPFCTGVLPVGAPEHVS